MVGALSSLLSPAKQAPLAVEALECSNLAQRDEFNEAVILNSQCHYDGESVSVVGDDLDALIRGLKEDEEG